MQDKINSIESDLELFDEHIEKLEEQKKQLEKDNLKLKMLIEQIKEKESFILYLFMLFIFL